MGDDLGLPMLPPFDLYHVRCGCSRCEHLLECVRPTEQHHQEAYAVIADACVLATHYLADLCPVVLGPHQLCSVPTVDAR